MEEIRHGDTVWRFDRAFLSSMWTCLWGRGCQGIGPEPAEHLGLGCCSIGADLGDEDEARMIAALAATVAPERFERHGEADRDGVFSDASADAHPGRRRRLHLLEPTWIRRWGRLRAAPGGSRRRRIAHRVEAVGLLAAAHQGGLGGAADDTEVATVRGWTRRDWGAEGETMSWCCTEGPDAYVGDRPVVDSLGQELEAVVGTEVYVELRRRLGGRRRGRNRRDPAVEGAGTVGSGGAGVGTRPPRRPRRARSGATTGQARRESLYDHRGHA